MSAALMRARAELRARWRVWLALALLLGIAGGVALTTAAGARRTRGVFHRLAAVTKAHDADLQVNGQAAPDLLDRIAALPQVAAAGKLATIPADVTDNPSSPFRWSVMAGAPADTHALADVDVPRLLAGRRANQNAADEAMVTHDFVLARGLGIGDTFAIRTVTFNELFQLFNGKPPRPTGPVVPVRIVGVVQLADEVAFTRETKGLLLLTRAFHREYKDRVAMLETLQLRFKNGLRDLPEFSAGAARLAGSAETIGITTQAASEDQIDDALATQSAALAAFSFVVGIGALLLIGQALARALWVAGQDDPTLAALGMSRNGRIVAAMIPGVGVAAVGALLAVAGSIAGSWFMPVGLARALEPARGVRIDPTVAVLGAAIIFVLTVARALPSTLWRVSGPSSRAARNPSTAISALARAGASPAMTCGSRFAFERGSGRSAVPVHGIIAGIVAGIVAMTAALTFDGSFRHLSRNPGSYGWQWDLVVSGGDDEGVVEETYADLASSPLVAGVAVARTTTIPLGAKDVDSLSLRSRKDAIALRTIEGREPRSPDEVALGSLTLREIGKQVGDELEFPGTAAACGGTHPCRLRFRITGRVLMWEHDGRPGVGALFTAEGQSRVQSSTGLSDLLVLLAPGVTVEQFRSAFGRTENDSTEPRPPADVQNLGRARSLNVAMVVILALLALTSIAITLVTAVTRRSRDIALLKVLGFQRSQVRRTVAWHATFVLAVAVVIGAPMGVIGGRWSWMLVASAIGVANEPVVPAALLATGTVALLLIANAVAMLPGRRAARTPPALVLRAE